MINLILLGIIVLLIMRIQDLKNEIGYLKRKHLRRIADVSNREPIEIKKSVGGTNGSKK